MDFDPGLDWFYDLLIPIKLLTDLPLFPVCGIFTFMAYLTEIEMTWSGLFMS